MTASATATADERHPEGQPPVGDPPAERLPDARVPAECLPDARLPFERLPDARLPFERLPYDRARVKVIACATVIEEMEPRMPAVMQREVLDFGLHVRPGRLTEALQAAIDASPDLDAILLGYGLCSRAVVGLRATHCRLVIPRVDDCIAIFLGSRDAYVSQIHGEPGTYYLTKGWIEVGDSPFDEADRLAEKYGQGTADEIIAMMLHNYTRLAFIDTGVRDLDRYREKARATAERYGLRFEEIPGSPALVDDLLSGEWDRDCVVVERGEVVRYESFFDIPGAPTPAREPGPAASGPTT